MKKTKKMKERIISIMLTLVMVVSLFAGMAPVEVQAAEPETPAEKTIVASTLKPGDLVEVGTTLISDPNNPNDPAESKFVVIMEDYQRYFDLMKCDGNFFYWLIFLEFEENENLGSWAKLYKREGTEGGITLNESIAPNEDYEGNPDITTSSGLWLCYSVSPLEDAPEDGPVYQFVSPDNLGGENSALKFAQESYTVEAGGAPVTLTAAFCNDDNFLMDAFGGEDYEYKVEYCLMGSYAPNTTINAETGELMVAKEETADTIKVLAKVVVPKNEYFVARPYVTNIAVDVAGNENQGSEETVNITISKNPSASVNVSEGSINEELSVVAEASDGSELTYQWYEMKDTEDVAISGATEATFKIPTDLSVGTYKYYCKITAGEIQKDSEVAVVTVCSDSKSEGNTVINEVEVQIDWNKVPLLTNGSTELPSLEAVPATVISDKADFYSVAWGN